MSFFESLFSNPLLQNALIASILCSILSGTVGSYVVIKRLSSLSGSLSHAIFAGLGISLFIQQTYQTQYPSTIMGALISGIICAVIIGWVHYRYKQREDALISAVWSLGMSLGFLFIAKTPGTGSDLSNYLFGNLLWVSDNELAWLIGLSISLACILLAYHKQLAALCFDEELAILQGIETQKLYFLLLILIAVTVVILMQVVGILLVMSLLTLPSLTASVWNKKLINMIVWSVVLSIMFCASGIWISYLADLPTGATISLISGCIYGLSLKLKK